MCCAEKPYERRIVQGLAKVASTHIASLPDHAINGSPLNFRIATQHSRHHTLQHFVPPRYPQTRRELIPNWIILGANNERSAPHSQSQKLSAGERKTGCPRKRTCALRHPVLRWCERGARPPERN